jgi:hypothetical protein
MRDVSTSLDMTKENTAVCFFMANELAAVDAEDLKLRLGELRRFL